jgi:hypothetical protein
LSAQLHASASAHYFGIGCVAQCRRDRLVPMDKGQAVLSFYQLITNTTATNTTNIVGKPRSPEVGSPAFAES